MRLFENPEFDQVVVRTAASLGVSEQFVEKDYWVTEILRIVQATIGPQVMFKGGTSLSKGWGLITRFSEDIDLFVNPQEFDPPPGRRGVDKLLEQLAQSVGDHPGLTWLVEETEKTGGFGRTDYFGYATQFRGLPDIRSAVRLEPGVQSGTFPADIRPITSLVADYLLEMDRGDMADDVTGFDMRLLHFRRTFVEKMFALHGKLVRLQTEGVPLHGYARHYADLFVLAGEDEVRAMLSTEEYADIRRDYDEKSRAFFPKFYRPPENLSFSGSAALFPDAHLAERLRDEYEAQCQTLFSGGAFPAFDSVLARFEEIRGLL